jgi:hypothetical protein
MTTTMRYEKKYRIGQPGAVYEFDVKLSMRMRGVDIDEGALYFETDFALTQISVELKREYPWITDVYLTGRSGGWLAIVDGTGGATKKKLEAISAQVDQARQDFETAIIEEFGYTKNGKQQQIRFPGYVDPKLRKAYDFFKEHAGGVVGEAGVGALNLARAEAYAKEHDWVFEWEDDPEEYQLGDAEDEVPPEVLNCMLRDEDGNVLASLGGIGMSGNTREDKDYGRVIEAELALEAMPEDKLVKNGTRTRWTDAMVLDSVKQHHGMTPQAEARAHELEERGFIDMTGTWKLTRKGQDYLRRHAKET